MAGSSSRGSPRDPGIPEGETCAANEPGLGSAMFPLLRGLEMGAEPRWVVVWTQD